MRRKHFEIITIAIFLLFSSCEVKREKLNFTVDKVEKILFIYDSSDPYAGEIVENTKWAFKYAKLNYDEFDLADYPEVEIENFENYYVIVFATEFIKKISKEDCERIKKFVASGGGLAVIYRGYNENLSDVFGVKLKDRQNLFLKLGKSGFVFNVNFLPMLAGTFIPDSILKDLSMFDFIHFGDKKIIASSSAGVPVAWILR